MNQLLDKFSYAETLNDAANIKTLSTHVNREKFELRFEKVVRSESILWRKITESLSVNDQIIESVRQIYPKGKLYIGRHNISKFDLNAELKVLEQVNAALVSDCAQSFDALLIKAVDGEIKVFHVYSLKQESKLIGKYSKTKILGKVVILKDVTSFNGIFSKLEVVC